jgi:hypothetical protein
MKIKYIAISLLMLWVLTYLFFPVSHIIPLVWVYGTDTSNTPEKIKKAYRFYLLPHFEFGKLVPQYERYWAWQMYVLGYR